MTQEKAATVVKQTGGRAGKYLTFSLVDQEYGLEILKVREIIGLVPITEVPGTPEFVKGVINLRGKVIPVADLRLKFAMASVEPTEETCIIVVDVAGVEMGIIVDHVSEVLDIAESEIEDTPSFGTEVNTDFILGMGKRDNQVAILLDISAVLNSDQLAAMASAGQSADAGGSDEKEEGNRDE